MAALTADKIVSTRGTKSGSEKIAIVTSATLYVGSMVSRDNATGRARAAAAVTGDRIAGVCTMIESDADGIGATGTGDASGTVYAHVDYGHELLVQIGTAARTNTSLGLNVFVKTDQEVAGTAVGTAATRVPAGELVAFEASDKTTGWVALRRFATTNIAV